MENERRTSRISWPVRLAFVGIVLMGAAFTDSKIKPDYEEKANTPSQTESKYSDKITTRDKIEDWTVITGFGFFISGIIAGSEPGKKNN